MSYNNPIHPPVQDHQVSSYSAISSSSASSSAQRFSHKRLIPQLKYSPTAKWKVAMNHKLAIPPIQFDYVGFSGQGVSVRDLSSRALQASEQLLAKANDPVGAILAAKVYQHIVFRISWPGYPALEWSRQIALAAQEKPLTRIQLAVAVAQQFGRFCEKAQGEVSTDPQWLISQSAITFDSLILVSLVHLSDNIWMAEVGTELGRGR